MAKSAARVQNRTPSRRNVAVSMVPGEAGREALALDPLVHDRTRLGLLSALAVTDVMTFVELRTVLNISDGNLSVHARKLEDAGFIECMKTFVGRVPRTEFRLAGAGRRALESYLRHMEALIRATQR